MSADLVNQWLVSRHDHQADYELLHALLSSIRVRDEQARSWGYFSSVSGGPCYLHRPLDSTINIFDIAVSLSRIPRWGGRVTADLTAYSVAQHSVMVSRLCRPENALLGLLHDATEAYLGDIISPMKKLLPAYIEMEEKWAAAISAKLGLMDLGFHDNALGVLPPDVKVADLIALEVERHDLLVHGDMWHQWGCEERPTLLPKIEPMTADEAFWLFMARYHELLSALQLDALQATNGGEAA